MSQGANAEQMSLLVSGEMTAWTADNVLDALGWPTYSGRDCDCPLAVVPVPGAGWALARKAGVRIPSWCISVTPMSPGDWEDLLDELSLAVPEAMEHVLRHLLVIEETIGGYTWPQRYLLGLTIR